MLFSHDSYVKPSKKSNFSILDFTITLSLNITDESDKSPAMVCQEGGQF